MLELVAVATMVMKSCVFCFYVWMIDMREDCRNH